ncbi:hypothetical protein CEXT_221321 [Caerostris extrusa]|uniref:Uncharacterized protein n=1 Tax=Caerostris extrusa TaxID=172846 RepID=A0AAV4U982_CAEEX|nr:hypothetical protein CEXT_221321 [Caerostris extrusa]
MGKHVGNFRTLSKFCLPSHGLVNWKRGSCKIYSGNGTVTHAFSVAKRVFLVTKDSDFGAGGTIFQLNQRPFQDKCERDSKSINLESESRGQQFGNSERHSQENNNKWRNLVSVSSKPARRPKEDKEK